MVARWLLACIGGAVALSVVVFIWFWLGLWSIPPDAYRDSWEWWDRYALPRCLQALPVAMPVAILLGWLIYRKLGDLQADVKA